MQQHHQRALPAAAAVGHAGAVGQHGRALGETRVQFGEQGRRGGTWSAAEAGALPGTGAFTISPRLIWASGCSGR